VRRAFLRHRRDIIAPLVMIALALGTLGYILLHQPAFHAPGFLRADSENPYRFKAELASANGIIAGQGVGVDVAGVTIGSVDGIERSDGRAVVDLQIERRYAPLYKNATILLRPRTPLKDMYIALDPGTSGAGALPEGATIGAASTLPDVSYDEILGNLDADTRSYLVALLSSAGQGLRDPPGADPGSGSPSPTAVADLRGDYRRFKPLAHDARLLFGALAARRQSLRRVVHDFERIATRVGSVDHSLSDLVDVSNRTFRATAARDGDLRAALATLPKTLSAVDRAAVGGITLGTVLRPTLQKLEPFARALGPALRATRPLVRDTTPVLRDQLRPFARDVQPIVDELRPAAHAVAGADPEIVKVLTYLNTFFNAVAYNPPGADEGFLFWGAWLSHIGPSVLTAQDAFGATPRAILLATCAQLLALYQVEKGNPSLGPILRLANTADRIKFCGATE
jgi:phospholipid/cholesterol/gamma-HCH transport system substrate-binding protein